MDSIRRKFRFPLTVREFLSSLKPSFVPIQNLCIQPSYSFTHGRRSLEGRKYLPSNNTASWQQRWKHTPCLLWLALPTHHHTVHFFFFVHFLSSFLSTADFWTPLQFLWALGRRWCLDDQGHLGTSRTASESTPLTNEDVLRWNGESLPHPDQPGVSSEGQKEGNFSMAWEGQIKNARTPILEINFSFLITKQRSGYFHHV